MYKSVTKMVRGAGDGLNPLIDSTLETIINSTDVKQVISVNVFYAGAVSEVSDQIGITVVYIKKLEKDEGD